MPITLGILAQSRQVVATGAFDLLESTVLTGNQTSVEFTNLVSKYGATYQHLQLRTVILSSQANLVPLRFNDSTASARGHFLRGTGSAVGSFTDSTSGTGLIPYQLSCGTSSIPTASVVDILDAFETTKNKTVRSFYGDVSQSGNPFYVYFTSGFTDGLTAAIDKIAIPHPNAQNFTQYSRFSLYGIKGA
jgi:hypothetical protein